MKNNLKFIGICILIAVIAMTLTDLWDSTSLGSFLVCFIAASLCTILIFGFPRIKSSVKKFMKRMADCLDDLLKKMSFQKLNLKLSQRGKEKEGQPAADSEIHPSAFVQRLDFGLIIVMSIIWSIFIAVFTPTLFLSSIYGGNFFILAALQTFLMVAAAFFIGFFAARRGVHVFKTVFWCYLMMTFLLNFLNITWFGLRHYILLFLLFVFGLLPVMLGAWLGLIFYQRMHRKFAEKDSSL